MKRQKKELEEEIAVCQKKFLRTLFSLVKKAHLKNKRDDNLIEMRERLKIGIRDAPEDIFLIAGEYVWEYRDDIVEGNVKKFLGMDFTDEIEKNVTELSEVEQIQEIIRTLKRTWRLFNDTEKKEVTKKVQQMLGKYVEWEKKTRELNTLRK